MTTFRRQLTLFVPAPEREPLEHVRGALDPRQQALIAAHVTLCREAELEPWGPVRARLARLDRVEVVLQFGLPVQLPDGCVMLPVVGGMAGYEELRQRILGPACRTHTPHLTLLHPRHAAGVAVDLPELARQLPVRGIRFAEIAVIEQRDGGVWRQVERFGDRDGVR